MILSIKAWQGGRPNKKSKDFITFVNEKTPRVEVLTFSDGNKCSRILMRDRTLQISIYVGAFPVCCSLMVRDLVF